MLSWYKLYKLKFGVWNPVILEREQNYIGILVCGRKLFLSQTLGLCQKIGTLFFFMVFNSLLTKVVMCDFFSFLLTMKLFFFFF